jgi:hypothetical protein
MQVVKQQAFLVGLLWAMLPVCPALAQTASAFPEKAGRELYSVLPAFPFHNLPVEIISVGSGKCLDVADASPSNGANVQQFTCHAGNHQTWFLSYLGNSDYQIRAGHVGGKNIDIAWGSVEDNANVQIYDSVTDAQIFRLLGLGDGSYEIVSKRSGKCLDVAGISASDNANIQQYTCNNGDNQRWWWSNFARRHVQLVQVATSAGTNRMTATDAVIQKHVDRANGVYRRYGIELVYDPSTDKSNVNSDALYQLGSSDSYTCPDESTGTSGDCARRYAAAWPYKVVIFTRPGNGFTSGDANHIAIGRLEDNAVCGDVSNTQWLAHEFGHYMGLNHTFVGDFADNASASKFLQDNGDNAVVFDGDKLLDTNPDPFYGGLECIGPHSSTATVALHGSWGPVAFAVDTNNVLSYYYNANVRISAKQAALTRATSFARGF